MMMTKIMILIKHNNDNNITTKQRIKQTQRLGSRHSPNASCDRTNPPHPHHLLFNKFKSGFIKCKNLLNTQETEPVHCSWNLSNALNMTCVGGVGFCGPHCHRRGAPRARPNNNNNNNSNDLIITVITIIVRLSFMIIIIMIVIVIQEGSLLHHRC